jgi:plasmid replication initiation protein
LSLQPRNKPLGHFVKKDNELTKAHFYDMSVTAYRIILLASSDKFLEQIKRNPLETIRITPADYHDVFGTGGDTSPSYRALKDSTKELLEATLWFRNIKQSGDAGTWSGGINWLQMAKYNDTIKALEIRFSIDIVPLILDVQKNYTYYNLRHISKLSSMHSIRLYELMMFWRKKGSTPPLSVGYMRTWLGVADGKYPEMKDFNKHIIKKSATEITDKSDIALDYEPQKEKRSVVGYVFSYTPKLAQVNEGGEDESFDQGKEEADFPPPLPKIEGEDDQDVELPF